MSILITGGAGFQGSHLAERLIHEGHHVTILGTDSERAEKNIAAIGGPVTWIRGSITDQEIVEKTVRNCDTVIHLAAHIHVDESIKNPRATVEVNVMGTLNVLEAARKYGKRLIHGSSCEVYGAMKEGDASMDETYELRPFSPYAASKAAVDRLCFAYVKTYDMDIAIVRPFNVFGERQKDGPGGALIPILVSRALEGEPLTIYGDGEQKRDYIYISDLIDAYVLVLRTPNLKGQVINFGTGSATSIKDIATYIGKKLNAPIIHGPARPGEVSNFVANIEKAKHLGFSPKISIWEGIDRYIAWKTQTDAV
ncbi:MAG TPA: dTDP-glucose 4,6-dehydratase [Candidatus Magasanikbacteria bacterium]|nr:dTDP-glucose 4,6-dehydratase [Candidatus Magasanikbacteria bacterium]